MSKKIIKILFTATIEVSEDFDINNVSLCENYVDKYTGAEMFVPKSEDFRVVDYYDIKEVEWMNKDKIRKNYSDFIGRNIAYCGLVSFDKIPKSFYEVEWMKEKTYNYICKDSSLVLTISVVKNDNEEHAELYLKELLGIDDLPRGYFELVEVY